MGNGTRYGVQGTKAIALDAFVLCNAALLRKQNLRSVLLPRLCFCTLHPVPCPLPLVLIHHLHHILAQRNAAGVAGIKHMPARKFLHRHACRIAHHRHLVHREH